MGELFGALLLVAAAEQFEAVDATEHARNVEVPGPPMSESAAGYQQPDRTHPRQTT
jgi:hypothetical protein